MSVHAPAAGEMPQPTAVRGTTLRAGLLGLLCITGVIFLIHWAELVLGGTRGHTAMANTSIPVGAFVGLICILFANGIIGRVRRRWELTESELIVIYSMTAVATVLASSGAIHFIVPAIAAPHYFASAENNWQSLFFRHIPSWIGPSDQMLLSRFFDGGKPVPVDIWLVPSLVWCGLIFAYAMCSLSIAALVRRQWIHSERLTFPTVYVPLDITAAEGAFWRNRLAWIGMAIPFAIGTLNTLHRNIPTVPKLEVRNINLSSSFREPPWNAIGGLRLSFYPFVIGIAFLLSGEVTFSCWFFYLLTKVQRVLGAVIGLSEWGTGGLSIFPFEDHQGSGAFMALAAVALWIGRGELAKSFNSAFSVLRGGGGSSGTERWPVWCLVLSFGAMVGFCHIAGMSIFLPILLLGLSYVYLLAATRIRAETGNAWLFGPQIDPQTLIVTTFGSRNLRPQDLTIMAYMSNFASYDLRCATMPHQLDAYKMADERDIRWGPLTWLMTLALFVGIPVAFWGAVGVWHRVGALAKADTWRTMMGKRPFDRLQGYLELPQPPDLLGLAFTGIGIAVTLVLFAMRTRITGWPLHPVGYAIANTPSMRSQWFPFLLAWAAKVGVLHYGGAKVYSQVLPFFFGLVVGDFINGGFYTLIACFVEGMKVYPINW